MFDVNSPLKRKIRCAKLHILSWRVVSRRMLEEKKPILNRHFYMAIARPLATTRAKPSRA
jgi:hypothetical protein